MKQYHHEDRLAWAGFADSFLTADHNAMLLKNPPS
jgi:hypothetical protein